MLGGRRPPATAEDTAELLVTESAGQLTDLVGNLLNFPRLASGAIPATGVS